MSLVTGGIQRSKVAMFGDSATGPKVIAVPCLKLILAWVGYFNRSPLLLSNPAEPKFLNPEEHIDYLGGEISIQTCINHINSLDHVHRNGRQALILIAAFDENVQRVQMFESNGGRGDWPRVGIDLPPLFVAGYLEPFGIFSAYAPLTEAISSISGLANLGLRKIQHAQGWLATHGMNPIIQPPLSGYMLSRKGYTAAKRE